MSTSPRQPKRKARDVHKGTNMYATQNVTFRAYEVQIDLIRRAAERTGKKQSDYIRDLIVPQAAADLGEELPPMPTIKRGRFSSAVARAAKARGLSPEDFKEWAAQQFAAQIFAEEGIPGEEDEEPAQPRQTPTKTRGGLAGYQGGGVKRQSPPTHTQTPPRRKAGG
jgi:hypothetical protein